VGIWWERSRSSSQVERNIFGFNRAAKLYTSEGETDDELLTRVDYVLQQLSEP
jgi:hypothetical protein